MSPKRIGAVYVWIILIALFTWLSPAVFGNADTISQVLNQYSVVGLVALGVLMPVSAGLFDLSIGSVAGLGGITSAWFLANVSANPLLAVLVGVGAALCVGLVNVMVVLLLRVDSFIGTLATSSLVAAVVIAISGDTQIVQNVNGEFQDWLGIKNILGLTLPVALMLAAMLILGFLLERTAYGRHVYAIGYDAEVARLGGIRVNFVRASTLLISSGLAGLGGICIVGSIGAGDPTIGPSLLLPSFAAVFLGATQFRQGRFNTWGAVVAVLLLGTGATGLIIVGAPRWSPLVFNGIVLIIAVALTSAQDLNVAKTLRGKLRRKSAPDRSTAFSTSDAKEAVSATPK